MSGEMDLAVLLRSLEPVLHAVPYGYGLIQTGEAAPDGVFAVIPEALSREAISANVVAGFYHDHVLVPWARRADAMAALNGVRVA